MYILALQFIFMDIPVNLFPAQTGRVKMNLYKCLICKIILFVCLFVYRSCPGTGQTAKDPPFISLPSLQNMFYCIVDTSQPILS